MKVKTTFELDHFIRYLSDFSHINVNRKEYQDGNWTLYLTDGSNYIISDQYWGLVQDNIPRLTKQVIQ